MPFADNKITNETNVSKLFVGDNKKSSYSNFNGTIKAFVDSSTGQTTACGLGSAPYYNSYETWAPAPHYNLYEAWGPAPYYNPYKTWAPTPYYNSYETWAPTPTMPWPSTEPNSSPTLKTDKNSDVDISAIIQGLINASNQKKQDDAKIEQLSKKVKELEQKLEEEKKKNDKAKYGSESEDDERFGKIDI
jgi:hypothetical protein